MKRCAFKGGPIFLNSGGSGPDDYLLKPLKSGRWHRVICRWGRHFTNVKDGQNDKTAMQTIFRQTHQICVPDVQHIVSKAQNIPTISMAEFLSKYGHSRVYVIDWYGRIRRSAD